MSYELVTEKGSQGQFASNGGYWDLMHAAKSQIEQDHGAASSRRDRQDSGSTRQRREIAADHRRPHGPSKDEIAYGKNTYVPSAVHE
jgi:hypothetical protein